MTGAGDRQRRVTLKVHHSDLKTAFEGQRFFEALLEI